MRVLVFVPLVLVLASTGVAAVAQEEAKVATASASQSAAADVPADKSKVVYVSDFELDVPTANGADDKGSASVAPASAAQSDAKGARREEGPAEQASKLVNLMSSTLVKELKKAGYAAKRMRPGDARPEEGIAIHGIFAETDEQNRLRRAVVGSGVGVGKMALFVGVGNLARPDQPLYAVADPKPGENEAGAVITVSAYAPIAKFEMSKNVTEKAVEDTASKIVADLSILLNANIAAVTR